jgi:putative transcriptional regulator
LSIHSPDATIVVRIRQAMDAYRVRTGRRITYAMLAERTGLAKATIQSLATRPGYNATLKIIAKICAALDCELEDLLVLERSARAKKRRG